MTANPVRPARHRPGKAMPESESSSEEEEVEVPEKKPERRVRAPPKVVSAPVVKDEARQKEEREAMERMAAEAGFVTESEKEEEEAETEDEEEEEESEEESESESEEERPRLMLRPKFIPKSQRGKSAQEKEAEEQEADEERRRQEANALVEEQIKRDLAARAAGRKHWEDSESEGDAELDDTDGLDPEAELAAFRLRKLRRYKRDREAMLAREAEIEELERRRNLTEEERAAEDAEKIRRQEEERGEKGKMGYMRKYFHSGAFYRDEAEGAGLLDRDIAGARFVDEVGKEKLPEYLQRRDMSKIGKKGATKYKDLRSEDTGRWGDFDRREGRRWDGDERFRPEERRAPGGYEGQGANAVPLGKGVSGAPSGPRRDEGRRDRYGGRDGGYADRERSDRGRDDRDKARDRETGGGYRDRSRSRERYRRRSPSRSPSRERHRRKRSLSPDRHDKRRRLDSR